MEIKAIETEYNGCRFRSRLEARWAVFFDELGVEYEYEPKLFNLDGLFYLPDFRVRCWGTRGKLYERPFDLWIEVKGVMKEKDAKKINRFADGHSILIVGNIPNPNKSEHYRSSFESYEPMNGTGIHPWSYRLVDGDYGGCYPAVTANGKFYLDGDCAEQSTMDEAIIRQALTTARYAKFEDEENKREKEKNSMCDLSRMKCFPPQTGRTCATKADIKLSINKNGHGGSTLRISFSEDALRRIRHKGEKRLYIGWSNDFMNRLYFFASNERGYTIQTTAGEKRFVVTFPVEKMKEEGLDVTSIVAWKTEYQLEKDKDNSPYIAIK